MINVPVIGNVDLKRLWKSRHTHAAVADTLPPPWRPAPTLALENRYVQATLPDLVPGAGPSLNLNIDPRVFRVDVDADSGTVTAAPALGDVDIMPAARWSMSAYGSVMMTRGFMRAWNRKSVQSINSLGQYTPATGGPRSGFSIPLPALPHQVASILGPGGPAINVRGSENIRISGTSNWTNQQVGPLGQKRSLFPSLDMQQDLDIQLEGQLSDRIRINLLQNSANQIPLTNRIAINYRGDEDALFQEIDLGNTNLTLPGTQYVSYSGKNEGLFGMKATSRFGPLDFTLLASKQEGRSERASYGGGASKQTSTIRDLEYIRGVYFFLNDPSEGPFQLTESSLNVYMDDGISSNDVGEILQPGGVALPDPTIPDAVAAVADSADSVGYLAQAPQSRAGQLAVRGNWNLLTPGPGKDYEIIGDIYGAGFKIIRLMQPLNSGQRLAVTYERRPMLANGSVGAAQQIGGATITDRDGAKRVTLKLLRVPADMVGPASTALDAVFDSTKALYPVMRNEMRNFYNLGGQRIDPATFKLTIRKGRDEPPKTTAQTAKGLIPYIEILGLDNMDESTDPPKKGVHDGKVDGTVLNTELHAFVDFENGTLFFPDLRPFAPRLGPGGPLFEQAVSTALFRRDSLTSQVGAGGDLEPNPGIYDHYTIQGDIDAHYFMDVEFTAGRATGIVSLGRGSILEGSEVVTINGQTLSRGKDYDIDYDLGQVTLKRQLGPADNLNVDYSYAPLFQQAGRTLIGSAFSLQGRDKSLGGAFMYESRGAQDLRPRLGEEPARSVIGDLNTDWTFRPQWMTHAVDMLPGVRTTAPSEFRFQAEVGASFPNPNTKNLVYLDDMEGVRDAVSLVMDQSHWRLSSVPKRAVTVFDGRAGVTESMLDATQGARKFSNAELHWYSPYAVVKEKELKPTLTDAQGAQNTRQVLALSIPRRPLTAKNDDPDPDLLWSGLTYSLDPVGLDLTRSQFIELWVNDFNDRHDGKDVSDVFARPTIRGSHVKLHVDVGKVSEDQMRSPDQPPDRLLNSEDKIPRDGQLDVSAGRNEDTGYDGLLDADEKGLEKKVEGPGGQKFLRDLVTSNDDDPEGDDFDTPSSDFKEEIDARRYLRTNGTEKDKNLYPYPETEDINLNGNLDTDESYYEYTIDLGDSLSHYLVTDLQQLKRSNEPGYDDKSVAFDNGWRRYRIPLDDSLRIQFGVPDLSIAQHVRIWIEGATLPDVPPDSTLVGNKHVERPVVMLGSLDIVGSRWRSAELDSNETKAGATLTLNSVNSVDNADVYYPPFDPGETRNGNQGLTRREQSIALEFTQLRAQKSVESYKTLSIDEDYSRYGKLAWYVTGFDVEDQAGAPQNDGRLYYYVRFASDELGQNYYEYRAPLPVAATVKGLDWQDVQLGITEMSGLKLLRPDSLASILFATARSPGSPDTLYIHGRPSFTRLRRISFGLVNQELATTYQNGQLWFDELRATEIAKDPGYAERVQVGGRFANLLQYNAQWNAQDENFVSVGQSRGSGIAYNNFGFNSSLDLHRFIEGTGIVLPVAFNFNQSKQRPRYSAGDDIVRNGDDLRRSSTFSDSRAWSVSYARTWSDRANKFLLYTVGGITSSWSTQNSHSLTPSGFDGNWSQSGAVNYNIAPRNLLAIPLPITRARLYLLPERFYTTYRFDQRRSSSADRVLGTDILIPRNSVSGSAATVNMGADSRPLDFLHHHIEAQRNLNLRSKAGNNWLTELNVGRVVNWSQTLDASWNPRIIPWIHPQLSWSSRFAQNNGPELSPDLSVRAIQNGQQATVRWEMPFGNLAGASSYARGQSLPPPPLPGDTTAVRQQANRPRGPALWRRVVSSVGNIQAELGATRGSSYSRVLGIPDAAYLFGLSSDPGFGDAESAARVTSVLGNQVMTNSGWRTSGRTQVSLPWQMGAQFAGDFDSRQTTSNGAMRGQDQLKFPDVTLDYGKLANALLIDKLIRNPQIRSSANRQVANDYDNSQGFRRKIGVTTLIQFRPFLSVSGDLPNGMRLELGSEHRRSDRQLLQLGSSLQQDINTTLSLNLTRSYTQGQKINFLGRESTVRSSITIGVNSQYESHTGRVIQNGVDRNPTKGDRLSVNANGSYGFSSNVSGNATLGFSQDRDQLRDIMHRSVRVELSARFGL